MKKLRLKLFFVFALVILIPPSLSEAYFTTEQTATKIDDKSILFMVSYKFGFLNRDLLMPIASVRGSGTNTPYVGFEILNNSLVTDIGLASGVILTSDEDVQIKDKQFYLPKGNNAVFTLVTILTLDELPENAEINPSLMLSHLPFIMIEDGEIIKAHLNPSELQYYRTPAVNI